MRLIPTLLLSACAVAASAASAPKPTLHLDMEAVPDGAVGVTAVEGVRGGALAFDGTGGFDHEADLAATNGFTIAVWVKPDSKASGYQSILENRAASFYLRLQNRVDIDMNLKGWHTLKVETAVDPDAWNHVAITYDKQVMRCYHNGVQVGEVEDAATNAKSIETERTSRIGWRAPDDERFVGAMDELLVFPKALDAAKIAALAKR